ncbi:MAG TPA: hypothetical protein VEW67_08040 [Thermoleophilaceae bacterium]|nr:hypothetical protein [Thermoleophilaceae bacterium]
MATPILEGVHARAKVSAFAITVLTVMLIAATPAFGAAAHDGWGFAVADDDWEWDDPGYLPSLEDEFAALGPKAFRFQMIWNAADLPWHLDRARGIIARARAQGVEQIVVTFKRSVGSDTDPVYGVKPTAEGYTEHVSEVVRLLADDVDVWGPANEPNRGETWLPGVSGAQLLAGYYAGLEDAVATWDPTAATTSPDFVDRADLGTIANYVNPYENAGGGWGDHVAIHPYAGAYNETTSTTLDIIGLAPPGASVWVTEVGAFGRSQRGIEASETSQNDTVWWLATILAELPQVERIHYYHMRGNPQAAWDTGLLNVDRGKRIAWHTWCAMAHGDLEHAACQPVTRRSVVPSPLDPSLPDPPLAGPASATAGPPQPDCPYALTCAAPPPDRTPPTLTIDRRNRLGYDDFMNGFAFRVRPSERSALKIEVLVRLRRAGDSPRRYVTVAKKSLAAADGSHVVRLKPRHRALSGRHRFLARLRVHATDLEGNRGTATKLLRVSR